MNDRFNHYWYKDIRNIVTLKDMLSSSVDLFGDNPAFWVKEKKGAPYKSISYKLLENDVKAIGTMLAQMGVGKKIAVMGQGSYEWICTYLAIVNSGNIAVPIDKELSGAEIENLLKASECDTVFCTKGDCEFRL